MARVQALWAKERPELFTLLRNRKKQQQQNQPQKAPVIFPKMPLESSS